MLQHQAEQLRGMYILSQYSDGTWTKLDWGFGDSILPGGATNRLMVERSGAQITAYINGEQVASISDGTYTGPRRVGLVAIAYDVLSMDIRFDNFEVYPLASGSGVAARSAAKGVPGEESGAAGAR